MSASRAVFFLCHQVARKPHDVPQSPTANPINGNIEKKVLIKRVFMKENDEMTEIKIEIVAVGKNTKNVTIFYRDTKQHSHKK